MKAEQVNKLSLPNKFIDRCLSANMSPPGPTDVKELMYASMSGIIPGRLHLCRACFRLVPAQQI